MSKLNVFGKPIVFDPGVKDPAFSSNNPSAPETVQPGDDLSEFTKSQAASYLGAMSSGNGELGASSRVPYSPFSLGDDPEPQVELETVRILDDSGKIPEIVRTSTGMSPEFEEQYQRNRYGIKPKEIIQIERQAESDDSLPQINRLYTSDVGKKLINDKILSPVLSRNRFTPDKAFTNEIIVPYRNAFVSPDGKQLANSDQLQRSPANAGYSLDFVDIQKLTQFFGIAKTRQYLIGGEGGSLAEDIKNVVKQGVVELKNEAPNLSNILSEVDKVKDIPVDEVGFRFSYGQKYSPEYPLSAEFGIEGALGTQLKLAALASAVTALATLLSTGESTYSNEATGRPYMGTTRKASFSTTVISSILGLPSAEVGSDFVVNAINGLRFLFPFLESFQSGSDSLSSDAFKDPTDFLRGSPFYSSVVTLLLQEISTIGIPTLNGFSTKQLRSLTDVEEVLSNLRNLKIVRFTFAMAELGLIQKRVDYARRAKELAEKIGNFNVRLPSGELGSSSKYLPGLMKIPGNLLAHNGSFKPGDFVISDSFESKRSYLSAKDIDKDDVGRIEDLLETEYMPFYIQDLRTNEIIAFHAFIEAMNDNFNVEVSKETFYGRMDPILRHKSTTRSLSISFFVAATNPDDHDMMWYKINRLIAMIYPQWTEGEKYLDGDNSFTRPFTQVPAASPLIRIRLGDYIKSNFSDASLERIFGMNFSRSDYEKTQDQSPTSTPIEISQVEHLLPGEYTLVTNSVFGAQNLDVFIGDFIPGLVVGFSPYPHPTVFVQEATEIISSVDNKVTIEMIMGDTFKKTQVTVYASDERKTIRFVPKSQVDTGAARNDSSPKDPIDKVNNIVFRSFKESSPGRGMAGMISGFKIDSNVEFPWETEILGSRAPLLVKIELQVEVIHDIAPGIDHNGIMRAPSMPVGRTINSLFNTVPGTRSEPVVLDTNDSFAVLSQNNLNNSKTK